MATTINSTALDFNAIKNSLKASLENSGEFNSYNFQASGLSSILDVLAYNTHYNALTANFALNESFLSTAQLRSSVVSLAEGIGYVPNSRNASQAAINLSLNLTGVSGAPSKIDISENFKFTSTVDDIVYKFQTTDSITATNDGDGNFSFTDLSGESNILIKEGIERFKTFIALPSKK